MTELVFCNSSTLNSISSIVFDNNGYLYTSNSNTLYPHSNIIKIDPSGNAVILVSQLTSPGYNPSIAGLVYLNGYIYATSSTPVVFKINSTTGAYTTFSTLPTSGTTGITYYNGYLYVLTNNENVATGPVYKIDITNGSYSIFIASSYFLRAMSITTDNSGNFYITSKQYSGASGKVLKFDNTGALVTSTFITGYVYQTILFHNNKLYLTNANTNTISQYDIAGTLITDNYSTGGMSTSGGGIAFYMGIFYVSNEIAPTGYGSVVILSLNNLVCFKEDTRILTDKGYIQIQDLRKGDLIKTLNNDFVPINMIGYNDMNNISSDKRIKNQLYLCSQDNYPEIFEDLIITGCHSILVDEFKDDEEEETKEILDKIYATDYKYRLPACVDKRSEIYKNKGTYRIYHIALDNVNYYSNYGIYANGLLVESCSKRYLKECSKMTLI